VAGLNAWGEEIRFLMGQLEFSGGKSKIMMKMIFIAMMIESFRAF
jgi:hypothetical protein